MKPISLVAFISILFSACSTGPKLKKQSFVDMHLYTMTNTPTIGKTFAGQEISLGGFSGLSFIQQKGEALYFQTITDRGPNGEPNGSDRPFLIPDYTPTIVTLKANLITRELSVVAEIKLKKKDETPLTGLPNDRREENPTDVFGLYYSIDTQGLDIEGLTSDGEGGWWVADEYAPSLARFNELGVMTRRLMPGQEIPRMYSEKKTNRGFEAVTRVENKVFGFLQSPLPRDKSQDEKFSRIVEVDLETMKTSAEYLYPFEKGNDKIGDALVLDAKNFLVLEQNGKLGEQSKKLIYKITLGESDKPVSKVLMVDLKSTPFNDKEKIEGLALIDHKRIALVYDNDFQIDGKSNLSTGLTPLNKSQNQLLVLEFKESFLDSAL